MVRSRNKIQNGGNRGFGYLELIVSLAVVAIGIVGLMRLQLMSLRAADYSKRMTQAVCLAESKLQEAMSGDGIGTGLESGEDRAGGMVYRWQREIAEEPLMEEGMRRSGGLYRIRVNVRWEQGKGPRHVELSSCIAAGERYAI